jgi:hypothetical protein
MSRCFSTISPITPATTCYFPLNYGQIPTRFPFSLVQRRSELLLGGSDGVLCLVNFEVDLASSESTGKGELSLDSLDSVNRVDVLDEGKLVASGGALAGDDGGVSKEEFPNLCILVIHQPNMMSEPTLYHLLPYLALTLSLLAIQFLYHLHKVAE